MRETKKRRICLLLCILGACSLASCGTVDSEDPPPLPESEEGVLIYAVLDPLTSEQKRRILNFNSYHPDAQIEVRDYSDEGGIDRLMTEFALGWVPDIMDLRRIGSGEDLVGFYWADRKPSEGEAWLPYRQMARKGYLEDLWPYIENDPDLGREGVVEAPLKAAEVDGGLYMLFRGVTIDTLIGRESVVGDRDSWTLEELMETFSTMPDGSTILRFNTTRWEMYSNLFCTTLDRYIDWEAGQCSFDNDEFRSMVEFLRTFPEEFKTNLTKDQMKEELTWRKLEGEQMLEAVALFWLDCMPDLNKTFGMGRVAFIGYPTADGSSGSFFRINGSALAMASTCRDKDTAWEFISYLIRPVYSVASMNAMHWDNTITLPVNRKSFENGNIADLQKPKDDFPPYITFRGGPVFELYPPTLEDLQVFERLVNSTTQIYWPDTALSEIIWEALGPYFAGDKTMDEAIQMVQNRVKLYVNEQK